MKTYTAQTIALCLVLSTASFAQDDDQTQARSLSDPLTAEEQSLPPDHYVSPEQIVREAFEAPPDAKRMSKRSVWIDRDRSRVYVDGYVAMRDGPLEMFACSMGTKEHESIVGTLGRASEVHAALLAVGANPGTPVRYLPEFLPPTGQRIRVWVCYRGSEGKFRAVDARSWICKLGTDKQMEPDWVFAGSGFWKDPANGREYYRADSGDMICVSNFTSAMLDVPIPSSAEANQLQFKPFTERIPPQGTPVRLVLVPIPIPTDKPDSKPKVDAPTPPTKEILPVKR